MLSRDLGLRLWRWLGSQRAQSNVPIRNLRTGLGDVWPRLRKNHGQQCLWRARIVGLRLGVAEDVVDEVDIVVVAANLVASRSGPVGLAADGAAVAAARNAARRCGVLPLHLSI